MRLRVQAVVRADEFEGLMEDWNRLLAESRSSSCGWFLSHEWLSSWWRHLGAGKLLVLTAHSGNQLIGAAPLFINRPPPFGFRFLQLIGTGSSDYGDVLTRRGEESAVLPAFLDWLMQHRSLWDIVDWREVPASSATALWLAQANGRLPFSAVITTSEPCLVASLPPSWDAFTASLSKRLRKNLRYYERALQKNFDVEFGQIGAGHDLSLQEAMKHLFRLNRLRWQKKWQPGIFYRPAIRDFHLDFASKALKQNALALHYLKLNGEFAAMHYCFHWDTGHGTRDKRHPDSRLSSLDSRLSTCFYYGGGFDPKFSRWSVGTVLLSKVIKEAIERGARTFDFLRGEERYKLTWGAVPVPNVNIRLVKRHSPTSQAAFQWLRLRDVAVRMVKKGLRRL